MPIDEGNEYKNAEESTEKKHESNLIEDIDKMEEKLVQR